MTPDFVEWYIRNDTGYIGVQFISTVEDFKKFFKVKNEKINTVLAIKHFGDGQEIMYRWTKKKGWGEPRQIDSAIREQMGDVYGKFVFKFDDFKSRLFDVVKLP